MSKKLETKDRIVDCAVALFATRVRRHDHGRHRRVRRRRPATVFNYFARGRRRLGLPVPSGLITEIGDWVLRTATMEAGRWRRATAGQPYISVNVSAVQLRDHAIVTRVRDPCAPSVPGCPPAP